MDTQKKNEEDLEFERKYGWYKQYYADNARFGFDKRPYWIKHPESVPVKEKKLIDDLITKIENSASKSIVSRCITQLEKKLEQRNESRLLGDWLDSDARDSDETYDKAERKVEAKYDYQIEQRLKKYLSTKLKLPGQ